MMYNMYSLVYLQVLEIPDFEVLNFWTFSKLAILDHLKFWPFKHAIIILHYYIEMNLYHLYHIIVFLLIIAYLMCIK